MKMIEFSCQGMVQDDTPRYSVINDNDNDIRIEYSVIKHLRIAKANMQIKTIIMKSNDSADDT